jgi:hypothetical protein
MYEYIHIFSPFSPPTLITVPIKRSATYFVDTIIMNETAKVMSLRTATAGGTHTHTHTQNERPNGTH